MIPITPFFLPCPDPIKPAHDPLKALKTEDKIAPLPHAQARIIYKRKNNCSFNFFYSDFNSFLNENIYLCSR